MFTFNPDYLPKSDVVFSVMFINKELCEKTLRIILNEDIHLIDISVESKNDLHQAVLNSIYFDVKTTTADGRIITLDLQRKYMKDRIRNRTVYYACREIASQKVERSKYEDLNHVLVSFILTEAPLEPTSDNTVIQLYNVNTNEIYSKLLTIHEINMKHITKANSFELQMLRDFFDIDDQNFVQSFGHTSYGGLLLQEYSSAVCDTSLLHSLGEEVKFMVKLSEEERLIERQEGLEKGREEGRIEVAKNLLSKNIDIQIIIETTGITQQELNQIQSS